MDVAYHDVFKEFDTIWGVKTLIVTRSNLVVTWMDRTQMSTISWFPLRLRWLAHDGCILGSFAIDFLNLCQFFKNQIKYF